MFKTFLKSFIFIFIAQCHLFSIAAQVKTCRLGTLGGFQPALLCMLNNDFQILPTSKIDFNVLLLHGPTGTGKSAIAAEFAKAANADFHFYSGSSIVTPFQGSGSDKIIEIFQAAKKAPNKQVIFIDEFDSIASFGNQNKRDDQELAFKQFNIELDALPSNSHIFVICATNYLERIPAEVRSRFGKCVCKIDRPNEINRRHLITKFYTDTIPLHINIEGLNELIKKNQFNEQKLNSHFSEIISALYEIKKIFERADISLIELSAELAKTQTIIEKKLNYIGEHYASIAQSNSKEFNDLKSALEFAITHIKTHIKKINLMNAQVLEYFIQKTEGLSIRDIKNIFKDIKIRMNTEHTTPITLKDIDSILEPFVHLRIKYQDGHNKQTEKNEAKERQKIDDQNRNMANKATKFGLLATGAAAGSAVAGTINATAAGLITTQTITVASPLVAKAALTKAAAAAIAAGKPIIAKTIAAKAAGITVAKAGSITVAKGLAGKMAIAATVPGANVVILGVCACAGAYAAYKFFIE